MADSAPAFDTTTGIDLMSTWGAILIGSIFSCVVWGISCMQLFMYFMHYGSDHIALKSLVVFVWLADTANQMLLLESMFPPLIRKWGSLTEVAYTQPSLVHHGWVAGLVSFAVQMFFIWRTYRFSNKKWWFPWLLVPFSLFQIIGTIPADIWLFETTAISSVWSTRSIAMEISLRACTAFVDIMIAGAMVALLAKNRGFQFTRSKVMFYRLIVLTINTGFWTAVVALIDFSFIAAFPKGLQFCAMEFPLSALYVNALLANLNARQYIRSSDTEFNTYPSDSTRPANLVFRNLNPSSGDRSGVTDTQDSMAIRVDTAKIVQPDCDIELAKFSSSV